jgi:hypothetical protein
VIRVVFGCRSDFLQHDGTGVPHHLTNEKRGGNEEEEQRTVAVSEEGESGVEQLVMEITVDMY